MHSPSLSLGILPNDQHTTRIGLRTRRHLRGATTRNRLKRQLRAIVAQPATRLRSGLDLMIVIHPRALPVATRTLQREFLDLCKRAGAAS